MEKIIRPELKDINSLSEYEEILKKYCLECKNETRTWRSSDTIYNLLRNELSNLTSGHCSFCDGFPLNDTSKETIEHYYPKNEFKEKTYLWNNLFLCCDKCQSNANSDKPFYYTLKMDDELYSFDEYFWFEPQDGKIKVLENIDVLKKINAEKFLKRYGINDNVERLQSRMSKYRDLVAIFKTETRERNFEPFRFVYDTVIDFLNYQQSLL